MSEKKYPIGGYAPGNYHNRCSTCERSFFGDKQAIQCEPCAMEAKARFDALPIEEQMQLVKKNAQIAQVMFERPVSPERDLILRIVEQWGNVIAMPKMEGWIREYGDNRVKTLSVAILPADDAVQNWFEENIDKECSASSAIYKFRLWLEAMQPKNESPAEQPVREVEAEAFAKYLDEQRSGHTADMWAEKAIWDKPNAFQEWLKYFKQQKEK